jgi:hypothetical protein
MTPPLRMVASVALLGLAAATVLLSLQDGSWFLRPAVTIAFFCLVPGWAIVANIALRSPAAELALALGLSLALSTACAQVMVWTGTWSPGLGVLALAAVASPLLLFQVLVDARRTIQAGRSA